MNFCGVRETRCSFDREDPEGERSSAGAGSVSDCPMGTSGGSDIELVGNTLCVSEVELSVTLVSAGGALASVASVARGQRM